jgi:hypothetical protein
MDIESDCLSGEQFGHPGVPDGCCKDTSTWRLSENNNKLSWKSTVYREDLDKTVEYTQVFLRKGVSGGGHK